MSTSPDTRHDELAQDFAAFHARHPAVFELFARAAFDKINGTNGQRKVPHYNACALLAEVREASRAGDDGVQRFKINANHGAFYARLFRERHPEHAAFFRLRKQKSKEHSATNLPPLGPSDFEADDK